MALSSAFQPSLVPLAAAAHALPRRRLVANHLWRGQPLTPGQLPPRQETPRAWLPHTWACPGDRGVHRGTPVLSHTAGRILCKSPTHSTDLLPWRPAAACVGGEGRGVVGWSGPGSLFNSARKETYLKSDGTKEDRSGFASTVSSLAESPAPCSTICSWLSAIWKEKNQPENWYPVASLASWHF